MRTTLDIDDDVLRTVKVLAVVRGLTAGRVSSDLTRAALAPSRQERMRNGVPLLPPRPSGAPGPTIELVNDLRD